MTSVLAPGSRLLGAQHGDLHLPPPERLVAEVARSGLLGRGGAGFPTGRKLGTVRAHGAGRAAVLANGCEGEPASGKDTLLLTTAPHLVLDGIAAAVHAVGATSAHLAVHVGSPAVAVLRSALAERSDAVRPELHLVERRYVASEESALVASVNGGPGLPTATPPRPYERGIGKRPTLVNNVETLAQLALVVRHGADWFREVGDPAEPGTQLLTVTGLDRSGVASRTVVEVPSGTTVEDACAAAGVSVGRHQAVLVGGWFGTWLPLAEATALRLTQAALRERGSTLGAGVLVLLPTGACGLAETARVARYLADQSARQCGPCLNGLPAIAGAVEQLSFGPWDDRSLADLDRWFGVVPGRGACRHPDGAVRFVQSALTTFGADVADHRHGAPCSGAARAPFLPAAT